MTTLAWQRRSREANQQVPIGDPMSVSDTAGWILYGVLVLLDPDLAHRSARSTSLGLPLAVAAGVDVDDELLFAFLLHDVGTLEIPAAVIRQPGPLTEGERSVVGRHAETSARILEQVLGSGRAPQVVLHHHERWDGTGYPDGLSGPRIPVSSRVLAVADTFTALVSRRPHRDPVNSEEALRIVCGEAGHQLDPDVVSLLARMAAERPERLGPTPKADRVGWMPPEIRAIAERAADLSRSQLEALFAAALGLDPEEAAARFGRSVGTQRNWTSSLRRALACPTRRPLPKLLATIGRQFYTGAFSS